jgi:hypothetical protein
MDAQRSSVSVVHVAPVAHDVIPTEVILMHRARFRPALASIVSGERPLARRHGVENYIRRSRDFAERYVRCALATTGLDYPYHFDDLVPQSLLAELQHEAWSIFMNLYNSGIIPEAYLDIIESNEARITEQMALYRDDTASEDEDEPPALIADDQVDDIGSELDDQSSVCTISSFSSFDNDDSNDDDDLPSACAVITERVVDDVTHEDPPDRIVVEDHVSDCIARAYPLVVGG